MEIYVLGIGSALRSEFDNTCFMVNADKKYLIDCPRDFYKKFMQFGMNANEVHDIILTHLHNDHVGNLDDLLLDAHYIQKTKVNIYTTREIFEKLRERAKAGVTDNEPDKHYCLEDFATLEELSFDKAYENGDIKIDIRANKHDAGIPTIGLKVNKNGIILGYSSDDSLRENDNFLWDSDIVFHEAGLTDSQIHTYYKKIEQAVKDGKVPKEKLYLIHIPKYFETELQFAKEGKYEVSKEGILFNVNRGEK